IAESEHWSERGRATSVGDAEALGRPRRSDVRRQRMRHFNIIFFLSALLVASCAANKPVYPLPRAAFPEPGVYLVQPGDSVTLIAKHLCLSVDRLAALNPGIDFSRLKIGQRLYYAPSPLPVRYHNARYDLTFYLPASWRD